MTGRPEGTLLGVMVFCGGDEPAEVGVSLASEVPGAGNEKRADAAELVGRTPVLRMGVGGGRTVAGAPVVGKNPAMGKPFVAHSFTNAGI